MSNDAISKYIKGEREIYVEEERTFTPGSVAKRRVRIKDKDGNAWKREDTDDGFWREFMALLSIPPPSHLYLPCIRNLPLLLIFTTEDGIRIKKMH